jgi:hypothetical protein
LLDTTKMLASQLTRVQIWSPRRLDCLLLVILVSLICPSYAYILPAYTTKLELRKHKSTVGSSPRKPANFPRNFATAVGVAVAAVIIGTTVICVFAHCWRQILDWGRDDEKGVVRRRMRKDEEEWFCGADRGLPMPQFEVLKPETELPSLSMQAPQPEISAGPFHGDHRAVAPAVYVRNVVPGPRTRQKDQCNNSGATLPNWLDSEEIERPASVAYLLDRP